MGLDKAVPAGRSLFSWPIPVRRLGWAMVVMLLILSSLQLGRFLWGGARVRRSLAESSLPGDLPYQERLQVLGLPEGAALAGWLPEGLRTLLASRARADSLAGLPRSLERLDVSGAPIARLGELPGSLAELDVSWTDLPDHELVGLPRGLRSLSLAGDRIRDLSILPESLVTLSLTQTGADLRGLPSGLRNLSLSGAVFDSLDGLPPSLRSLSLTGTRIRSLEGLPTSLRSLALVGNDDLQIDRLPPLLTELVLTGTPVPDLAPLRFLSLLDVSRSSLPAGAVLPDSIADLRVNGEDLLNRGTLPKEAVLRGLPLSLQRLELMGEAYEDLAALSPDIESLSLSWYSRAVPPKLPVSLRSLSLSWSAVTTLKGLPQDLRELDISATNPGDLGELARLRRLETLRFRWAKVEALPAIPGTVTALDLGGSRNLRELPALPPGLVSLDVSQTRLSSLPENLDSLRILDISNTGMRDLRRLPRNLEVLTLSRGQVQSLEGLPTSVHTLYFVESLGGPEDHATTHGPTPQR